MHANEDFTASDWRHTLNEAWRIAADRRWWFIFTFCAASTLAFTLSHWLPRRYVVKTLFERRNDVVLTSLIGEAWNSAFEAQRKSLTFDLTGPDALLRATTRTAAARGWPRNADGMLTAEGRARQAELVARLNAAVGVRLVESTPQRDVIELSLKDNDPQLASEAVVALRDDYICASRTRMVALLRESLDYFTRESAQTRKAVADAEARRTAIETAYPAVLPEVQSALDGERNRLAQEEADLRRRLAQLADAEQDLARRQAAATSGAAPAVGMKENPRRAQIMEEIRALQKAIVDERVLRGKTDEHPSVLLLYEKLQRLRQEFQACPAQIVDAAAPAADDPSADLRRRAAQTAALKTQAAERLVAVEARLTEIKRLEADGLAHRPNHQAATKELETLRADLATWQRHIEPIERILAAQQRDRGMQFISVEEPGATVRPTSPNVRVLIVACLAIGALAGALAVLLIELMDRSYRTALRVARSLGLPVLESIDEIVTRPERRRRLVHHLVVLPAVTMLLLAAMAVAGASAYLRLESPWQAEPSTSHAAPTPHANAHAAAVRQSTNAPAAATREG